MEKPLVAAGHLLYLISFVWDGNNNYFGKTMEAKDLRFFLDSGAFTAWSSGKDIDLDEYCEFIRANIEYLDVYASLDCIPGSKDKPATPQERDRAALQSWENYLYMKNAGLDPLPVYHYGEDPRWLEQMLEYGCQYIGIGGLVGIPSKLRRHWLDRVFTRLTDDSGNPIIKTHGFGMTAIPLIFRYPWYSVDSTSWLKATMSGAVYLPQVDASGKFLFDVTPYVISVSSGVPGKSEVKRVPLITTRGDGVMKLLARWLEECGTNFEQVSGDYYYRAICNVTFFKKVSELKVDRPFSDRIVTQGRFF